MALARPSTWAAMPPTTRGGYSHDSIRTRIGVDRSSAGAVTYASRRAARQNTTSTSSARATIAGCGSGSAPIRCPTAVSSSPCGRPTPSRCAWSATGMAGTTATRWSPRQVGRVGRHRFRMPRCRLSLQVRHRGGQRHREAEGRTRWRTPPSARRRHASVVAAPTAHAGPTTHWMATRGHGPGHPLRIYEVHLGFVASRRLHLSRAGPPARRPRQRARLHPHRVAAGRRAPVRRLVGLPGHRLLRADGAVRHPRRLPRVRRRAAPARHRRDPRLGACPLPRDEWAWPASTAPRCTSTPTRARASTRTGARCVFNYGRNEVRNFLDRQRAVLAAGVPHRRAARRCGRQHVVPRLLARARASGCPTATAAARTSTRSTSCGS